MNTPYNEEIAEYPAPHILQRLVDKAHGYAAALASEEVQGLVAAAQRALDATEGGLSVNTRTFTPQLREALAAFEQATKKEEEAHGK